MSAEYVVAGLALLAFVGFIAWKVSSNKKKTYSGGVGGGGGGQPKDGSKPSKE